MTESRTFSNRNDNVKSFDALHRGLLDELSRAARIQNGRKNPVDISNDFFVSDEFERLFDVITNAEKVIIALNERLTENETTIHKLKGQISELSSHKSATSEQVAKTEIQLRAEIDRSAAMQARAEAAEARAKSAEGQIKAFETQETAMKAQLSRVAIAAGKLVAAGDEQIRPRLAIAS